jgi:hypothetical protein
MMAVLASQGLPEGAMIDGWKVQAPAAHLKGGRPGPTCTSRGCAASPPAWLTARAAPVSGPPRHLRSSTHPQHGLFPAYTLRAILEHLGLPTAGARLAPAREPLLAACC